MSNKYLVKPNEKIAGKTQSEWGDKWWQWYGTTPQDDNPVYDRTGDFAGVNQLGKVYFLAGVPGSGSADRKNVIVPQGKTIFLPIANTASVGNDVYGDTRFPDPNDPTKIGDIAQFAKGLDNTSISISVDGKTLISATDAKKFIQSSQNLTDGFKFTTPENNPIIPGFIPDNQPLGKNYQSGYYVGLKDLTPGKHTIKFSATDKTTGQKGQDISYEIEVKSFNEIVKDNNSNDIYGTWCNDNVDALGGNDTVYGYGGDDIIDGGAGNDKLYGGDGNDILYGGAGKDLLNGDRGDDVIAGGLGDDTINGGDGNDRLYGGSGKDVINGGKGNDKIFGGLGNDKIDGGRGDDIIDGVAYSHLVLPVTGKLPGLGEIDTIKGGSGRDTFVLGMASGSGISGSQYYVGTKDKDYALIQDFQIADGDKIQLFGNASQYILKNGITVDGHTGIGIYTKDSANKPDDLVGVLENPGFNFSDLSLTKTSQFSFVS